jgi:HEAT repeat protein
MRSYNIMSDHPETPPSHDDAKALLEHIASVGYGSGDPQVRAAAARSLGELCDPAGLPVLVTLLQDGDPTVRLAAAHAYAAIEAEGSAAALLPHATDPVTPVRVAVVEALGVIGDALAVATLIKALRDPDGGVRKAAADALGGIEDQQCLYALCGGLQDPLPIVRVAAALALANLRPPLAALPLCAGLQDPIPAVRRAIAYALGYLGVTETVDPLIDQIRVEMDRDCQIALLDTLAKIGVPEAFAPVQALLEAPDPTVRAHAAAAMSRVDYFAADQILRPLLTAPDADLRRAALWGLSRTLPDREERALLSEQCNDCLPARDPAVAVDEAEIARAEARLCLEHAVILEHYRHLAERFALHLASPLSSQ